MKINIINYETSYGENWIFTALANKINSGFLSLGHESIITSSPAPDYGLYFHISYGQADLSDTTAQHVVYVTHIDDLDKLARVVELSFKGGFYLCMSNDTAWRLNRFSKSNRFYGILSPSLELNDSHDDYLKIFFAYRIYSDGRKNVEDVLFIINYLSEKLKLKVDIMGAGWEKIAAVDFGSNVVLNYFQKFQKVQYHELIRSADYLCYSGLDEGAISVLDALVHQKGVITTSQGYHLDFAGTRDYHLYSCRNQLINILDTVIDQKIHDNNLYSKLTSWDAYCEEILSKVLI